MPVNIMIGVLAIILAFIVYTIATWAAFRSRTLKTWHLVLLWIGVVLDITATAMMAIQIGGIAHDLHTVLALVGMAGMIAAAAAGSWAYGTANEPVRASVARWVAAPWAIWALVFVWGMVERGSQRIAR